MAHSSVMSREETQIVHLVYTKLQQLMASAPPEVNVRHFLTAMTMMLIGQAAISGVPEEVIADHFAKIGNAIVNGDYDNYIQQTKLLNEQPPTATKQ